MKQFPYQVALVAHLVEWQPDKPESWSGLNIFSKTASFSQRVKVLVLEQNMHAHKRMTLKGEEKAREVT